MQSSNEFDSAPSPNSENLENEKWGSNVFIEIKIDGLPFENAHVQNEVEQQGYIDLENETIEKFSSIIVEKNATDEAKQVDELIDITAPALIDRLEKYKRDENELSTEIESALICFENFLRKENGMELIENEPKYNGKALANLLCKFLEKNEPITFLKLMAESALSSSLRNATSLEAFFNTLAQDLIASHQGIYQGLLVHCFERYYKLHADSLGDVTKVKRLKGKRDALFNALELLPDSDKREQIKQKYDQDRYSFFPGEALKSFISHAIEVKKLTIDILEKIYSLENDIKSPMATKKSSPATLLAMFWNAHSECILRDASELKDISELIEPVIGGSYKNFDFVEKFLKKLNEDQAIKNRVEYPEVLNTLLKNVNAKSDEVAKHPLKKGQLNYAKKGNYKRNLEKITTLLQTLINESRELSKERERQIEASPSQGLQNISSILDEFVNSGKVILTSCEQIIFHFIKNSINKTVIKKDAVKGYSGLHMTAFLKKFILIKTKNELVWKVIGEILVCYSSFKCTNLRQVLLNLRDYVDPDKNEDLGLHKNTSQENLFFILMHGKNYLQNIQKDRSIRKGESKFIKKELLETYCDSLLKLSPTVRELAKNCETSLKSMASPVPKNTANKSFVDAAIDLECDEVLDVLDVQSQYEEKPLKGDSQNQEENLQMEVSQPSSAVEQNELPPAQENIPPNPMQENQSTPLNPVISFSPEQLKGQQERLIEESPINDAQENPQMEQEKPCRNEINAWNNIVDNLSSAKEKSEPHFYQPSEVRSLKKRIVRYENWKEKQKKDLIKGPTKNNVQESIFLEKEVLDGSVINPLNNFSIEEKVEQQPVQVEPKTRCFKDKLDRYRKWKKKQERLKDVIQNEENIKKMEAPQGDDHPTKSIYKNGLSFFAEQNKLPAESRRSGEIPTLKSRVEKAKRKNLTQTGQFGNIPNLEGRVNSGSSGLFTNKEQKDVGQNILGKHPPQIDSLEADVSSSKRDKKGQLQKDDSMDHQDYNVHKKINKYNFLN